jgi:hygromycin-B 7''-O-kinase
VSTPIVYSQRLGAISDAQFQTVLTRFGLGRLLHATPTTSGLFGQNVFLSTTVGEFVLRGAPHWVKGINDVTYWQEDRWQFTKERFFAQQLHKRADVPVPWPMHYDQSSDLMGWPYLVMPRMPGHCFDDHTILKTLSPPDRTGIAVALGRALARMQRFHWPFAGDFSLVSITLEPYPSGYTQQVIDETRMYTKMAEANGAVTMVDREYIESVFLQALAVQGGRPNTFVHGDYKLNNLTVLQDQIGWRVAGIFDLHEARFGDGILDIVRQTCSYLDTDPSMADWFVQSYLENVERDERIKQLLPLYVVNDRMKFWEYFSRPEVSATWREGKTFGEWSNRYVRAVLELVGRMSLHG